MRILYLSDSSVPSYSANSIHVIKMCHAWACHGNEVTLIAKNTNACVKGIRSVYHFYGVSHNFKIIKYPYKAFPGSGRLYNLLLPFFAFGKFDIVYTRAIYPAFWYCLFKKTIAFEIHEPFNTKNRWLSILFDFILKSGKVSKWVVISAALKNYLKLQFSISEDNIIMAHDGADLFPENIEPKPLTGDFKIGYVGSLLAGKGMELIIPLSKRCPIFTFHIVGGHVKDVDKWRTQLEVGQKNVIFHGFVAHADTPAFIISFDVLIAPYQESVHVKRSNNSNNIALWMSPLKIFEYMSSGKPIISSDLPVLKEVLRNKKNAILNDPININDWSNSLVELKKDECLRKDLGSQAKKDFLNKYSWSSRAKVILDSLK